MVPVIAAVGTLAIAPGAMAETRRYYCGEASFISVETIDATTISAGLIGGKTITLGQLPGTRSYSFGNTTIALSGDRNSIQITQGGSDVIGCVFPVPVEVVTPGDANANVQAQSAPGVKPDMTIRSDGAATVETEAATEPFPAKSWGGVVRDGPGMEHAKIASLKEGDPITVEQSTGVDMNGYPWFKIRFGKDRIGYQWGGIICPVGQEKPGTFEKCD
ncbi:hypothetical protein AX760_03420 [Pararhizobium antarcticum]|uniref:Uncharacterized protein n=1 Tax=Pararhizobium antarcticum TaxID=1798805 RepID=A0A657LSA6_9HYPH|nr:hypothetical protein AX761_18755 [Rhizobium sp. 58]OJF96913.1 hypothetical protein AX760_03420 [Pararhizobium antarcticum]